MKNKSIYLSLIFFLASAATVFLESYTDLLTIFRVLAVMTLVYIILLRLRLGEEGHNKLKNRAIFAAILFGVSLFFMLIVVTTGGFFSPLFVVLHIATIALAFLSSFPVAMSFLFASILAVSIHTYMVFLGTDASTFDLASIIIQITSIAGVIPFSAIVASKYHSRGKLAESLSAELSAKQEEEGLIVENIEEGVIILNRKFEVSMMNKIAQKLSGVKNTSAREKNFFETFKLFDVNGRLVSPDQFPMEDLLSSQYGFSESSFALAKPDGSELPINFKFSSILGSEGKIAGFLFVFNEKHHHLLSSDKVLSGSFERFWGLIAQINQAVTELGMSHIHDSRVKLLNKNSKRLIHAFHNIELLYRLAAGQISGLLAYIDVGDIVRKKISQAEDLAKQYKISVINSTPLSPPLPIKTNKEIFEEAIGKLMELAIFIAAESPEKFVIVSTGLSEKNIFVFIKISTYDDFPWNLAGELIKPFFGKAESTKLSEATGLEGYLAETLIKEKNLGGGIVGKKFEDGIHSPQLLLTLILPYSASVSNKTGFARNG